MAFVSLANRLADTVNVMPMVLCGPILRKVETKSVTVWVAVKDAKKVWLEVYEDIAGELERPNLKKILAGERKTITVGKFLHIVAVTAVPLASPELQQGKIYYYNLFFTDPNATTVSTGDINLESPNMTFFPIHYADEPEDLGDHDMHTHLPSFCVPPSDFKKLRIVHGSCRKAHAEGLDAMPAIDEMILTDRFSPDKRPHYLFLTGDQFYADDVSRIMLYLLMDAEKTLFNGVESLPHPPKFGVPVLPDAQGKNSHFFAGDRLDVGGFTSHESNGLATAGEYMSYYLFMWSDILWMNMSDFPDFTTIDGKKRNYDAEFASLEKFRDGLSNVKRAMANVPTFMIFDDHDITDDWYMTFEWCEKVLKDELGRRMVLNGLVSYAIFQDWGNKPDDYQGAKHGAKLLELAEKWFAPNSKRVNPGAAQNEEPDLQKFVGIPSITDIFEKKQPVSNPISQPIPVPADDYFVLKQDADAIKWYYTISNGNYEIIFLDGRTRRGYPDPAKNGKASHPDIISLESAPLQIGVDTPPPKEITILIAPTPVISIPAVEINELPSIAANKAKSEFEEDKYEFDIFDHWKNQTGGSENLLALLSQRNTSSINTPQFNKESRLVILTGDVHFCAVSRMQYEFATLQNKSLITQLVSSSFKKQDYKTRVLHQLGYKFGNISGIIVGNLFMGIWGDDMWNLIRDIDNRFLRTMAFVGGAVAFLFLFLAHMVAVVLAGLMLVADTLFFQDWFNEQGADARHILGWFDPAAKESVTKLRIPVNTTTANPPQFEEIILTKPYAVNKKVLNEVVGPNIQFPDWQYHIHFIIAANEVRAPASDPDPIPPLVDAPSPGDRKKALSQYLALASNHLSYTQKYGNGKEIVGVNNISEVFFEWNGTEKSVRQESWWRLQGKDGKTLELFPLSKYKVSLNFDDPAFPFPR
ncbi:MAG TPA: hypothetical protein VIU35_12780 [Chitinophagaceae bacterium]